MSQRQALLPVRPVHRKRLAEPPKQGSAYGLTELIAREGQELINAFVGLGGQLIDDIGKPWCRIELMALGCREQTLNRCGAFARALTTGKKPVLFFDQDRAYRVFNRVVVNRQLTALRIAT